MILYINSCVRDNSRTDKLARAVLDKFSLDKRTKLIETNDYRDKMFDYAKQFAKTDTIVISAPYWDYSFPVMLKTYLENIYVTGIVSKYSDKGVPIGLCNANKLYYITTAGGKYVPEFSYDYIKGMAIECFGIKETKLIYAQMLDIVGNNADNIIADKIKELDKDIL